jgi:hypothetical protein
MRIKHILFVTLFFMGCSGLNSSPDPSISINGKVIAAKAKVPLSIDFIPRGNGREFSVNPNKDGTFSADCPPGKYRVVVNYKRNVKVFYINIGKDKYQIILK